MSMYCDQCEQTFRGNSCTGDFGVCGKSEDIESLQKILLYGLKGMCAYAHHARRLGKTDEEVNAFVEDALFLTVTNVNFDMQEHLKMIDKCGAMNLKVMKMLNDGHVETFGQPAPVEVKEGVQEGPGIVVTGHDLVDLKNLLEQTDGTGVNVYTHGEMLPAHSYPELKKYPHLKGHFGGAWQKQRKEFQDFGGPILATTNCVMPVRDNTDYINRFYSTRCTALPGGKVISGDDYTELIKQAQEIGSLTPTELKTKTVGFHFNAILGLADKIVTAVKEGKISRFFVIGGCDGAEPGRNYFTEFADETPKDSIVLTMGCGKYRIREVDFGTINLGGVEVPRLLDMGQCNDSYGAVMVALALSEAFECGVNDLPLSLVISWFEQKAVAVLLTLLHLGVKSIKLGPALPAFVSPNVLNVLVETYNLGPVGENAKADVAEVFA